jgi:hypothetical protein
MPVAVYTGAVPFFLATDEGRHRHTAAHETEKQSLVNIEAGGTLVSLPVALMQRAQQVPLTCTLAGVGIGIDMCRVIALKVWRK